MKNSGSGGRSRGDTDHVFDLGRGDVEVLGDRGDTVAGEEAVDEILDAGAAVGDDRKAEGDTGIDDDLSGSVGGQHDLGGPAVAAVGDAPQVVLHDVGELALSRPDDHQVEQFSLVA